MKEGMKMIINENDIVCKSTNDYPKPVTTGEINSTDLYAENLINEMGRERDKSEIEHVIASERSSHTLSGNITRRDVKTLNNNICTLNRLLKKLLNRLD